MSPDDVRPVSISHGSGVPGFRVLGDGFLVGPGHVSAPRSIIGDLPITTRLTITSATLSTSVNASLVAVEPYVLIALDSPLLGAGIVNPEFPDFGALWLRAVLDDSPESAGDFPAGAPLSILDYLRQAAAAGRIEHGVSVPPVAEGPR